MKTRVKKFCRQFQVRPVGGFNATVFRPRSRRLDNVGRFETVASLTACLLACALINIDFPGDKGLRCVAARAQIAAYSKALQDYRKDVGDFPSTNQGLQALRTNPGVAGWDGPYVDKDVGPDPWGYPYIYCYRGAGTPEIISRGQSGRLEPSLDSCKPF